MIIKYKVSEVAKDIYNTSYEDKLKMDLLYIENFSLIRDLQLLFLTVRAILFSSSTQGFSEPYFQPKETGQDAKDGTP